MTSAPADRPGPATDDRRFDGPAAVGANPPCQQFFRRNEAPMLQIDPASGRIVDANEAAARFYGWSRAVLRSMSIQDINRLPPEEIAAERQAAVLEHRNRFVFPHRLANGETRTVEVHSTPIEVDGRTLLWSIVHDVTAHYRAQLELLQAKRDVAPRVLADLIVREAIERAEAAHRDSQRRQADLERVVAERTEDLVQARQRAERADRAKSVFLSATSHELRTPLNSIIGFSRLLVDGAMGSITEEQRRALQAINRAGEQQLAIVRDILDFTVIETGQFSFEPTQFGLRGLLVEQCEAAGSFAATRGLTIRPVECDASIVADADRVRVGQVVRNLLANAIRYTDTGHVLVRALVAEGRILVEVQDTGIGIPAERQDELFRPFARIEGRQGPRRERTGLGLALSARLVEGMGGTIGVESTPGIGSTFRFTLAVASAAGHAVH